MIVYSLCTDGSQWLSQYQREIHKNVQCMVVMECSVPSSDVGCGSVVGMTCLQDGSKDIILPGKPEEPQQSDCCGTGCTPCVFDIYDQEVALWEKECQRLRLGITQENVNQVISFIFP